MERRLQEQNLSDMNSLHVAIDNLDIFVLCVTGLALIYSIVLAIFRHNVWEDLGIFDSLSEILKFLLLFACSIRYQSFRITEKRVLTKHKMLLFGYLEYVVDYLFCNYNCYSILELESICKICCRHKKSCCQFERQSYNCDRIQYRFLNLRCVRLYMIFIMIARDWI